MVKLFRVRIICVCILALLFMGNVIRESYKFYLFYLVLKGVIILFTFKSYGKDDRSICKFFNFVFII